MHGICLVEFDLTGSEGLKGRNFSSFPLLTVIVLASSRQERIYPLSKELEVKGARLRSSLCFLRNILMIIQVPRLKALSRVVNTVIELCDQAL